MILQELLLEDQHDAMRNPPSPPRWVHSQDVFETAGPATAYWSAGATFSARPRDFSALLSDFRVLNWSAVDGYLLLHPFLEGPLRDAKTIISESVPQASLSLAVERLPSEQWSPKLVLRVSSCASFEQRIRSFDEASDRFWSERQSIIDRRLRITLE